MYVCQPDLFQRIWFCNLYVNNHACVSCASSQRLKICSKSHDCAAT